ncbi:DUF397 domain-containing protein [Streptomyces sp. SID1034]|nr:DUF397 domain-containing protein [Streptomyces sp. SID1034]
MKSRYSDGEGGNCVEASIAWRKSSYSDATGDPCVKVALVSQPGGPSTAPDAGASSARRGVPRGPR